MNKFGTARRKTMERIVSFHDAVKKATRFDITANITRWFGLLSCTLNLCLGVLHVLHHGPTIVWPNSDEYNWYDDVNEVHWRMRAFSLDAKVFGTLFFYVNSSNDRIGGSADEVKDVNMAVLSIMAFG